MSYKHFYRAIIIRLVFIIILAGLVTYLYFNRHEIILSILFLIFLVLAVINIIRYFNSLNNWISSFLLGIENDDTTLKTPSNTDNKSVKEVYAGIERLNKLFRQTKLDIGAQEQYYRSIIDQSATGLFSVNEQGRVININPAATKLTKLNNYQHINALLPIAKELPDLIMGSSGKAHRQSAIFENSDGQKLLFRISKIIALEEVIKLVAVSDITKELDNREIDSWIKLARTLSHEIMNNIAPITTLSKVISGYFTSDKETISSEKVDAGTIANTVKGLKVIEERSIGLINFVDNYRRFTKLPEPHFKKVDLTSLIENSLIAASAYPGFDTIKLKKNVPKEIQFSTDEKLLSQVILNLLKNALEALILEKTQNPEISINLLHNGNTVNIEISNNGPAIPPEIREQIFIPFYTTKDNGSGIGLSLSKQIILQMGGDIILSRTKEGKTTFTIIIKS
jgi:nitrogen fixation/metabolism regulation signal transduction histidine kinase